MICWSEDDLDEMFHDSEKSFHRLTASEEAGQWLVVGVWVVLI